MTGKPIDSATTTLTVDLNSGPTVFGSLAVGDKVWVTDGETRCRATVVRMQPPGLVDGVVVYAEPDQSTSESLSRQPVLYAPDFSGIDGPSVFVQWKGTDVCLDFTCECGATGHYDGEFAYALRCGACGRAWALPHTVALVPLPEPWASSEPRDVVMDDDDDG